MLPQIPHYKSHLDAQENETLKDPHLSSIVSVWNLSTTIVSLEGATLNIRGKLHSEGSHNFWQPVLGFLVPALEFKIFGERA